MRLDAEYFQPEYLEIERTLMLSKRYKYWKDIDGRFITGPFGSEFNVENYIEKGKYRYVRGKDVKEFFLLDNDNVYIPEKDFVRLNKYALKESDILVSVVGTLGNTVIVDSPILPAIYSCKSTVFRTKEVNPYYLIAFLNSKYGRKLLERSVRGAVQTGLNIDDLKSLPIYVPSNALQLEVSSLVLQSKKEIDSSKLLYQQAEDLLLEELGLKDIQFEDDLSFVINSGEVKTANRTDAEYYRPKYKEIIKILKKNPNDVLENCFYIIRSKNFLYTEEGDIGVIKTKQLGKQFLGFQVENVTTNEVVDTEKLPTIQDRDVLFASMGVGSLGKTNIYYELENDNQFTIDSTLKIFRAKKEQKLLPEVLSVYLSSEIGQQLIYKYIVGSSGIISIYDNYIRELIIPILPKSTQQKIADLVRQSHESRKKSKELLEQAKSKVEEIIKKG
ncbi:MAG: restriction endonuclease subunit S [bacterium]|nr:restriction endonuclease subunit S [bacterium]